MFHQPLNKFASGEKKILSLNYRFKVYVVEMFSFLYRYSDVILKYTGNPIFWIWVSHTGFVTLKVTIQSGKASLSALSKNNRLKTPKKTESQVLFFPDKKQLCPSLVRQDSKCNGKDCLYGHKETSLWKLISVIQKSQFTIDVCVFVITSQNLADILIKKHKEGIVVRVVTDCEKMDLNCSQIEQMRSHGIQVRHDKTSYFMHHKFAILDGETLVNGSFNWTKQAITGNQENVIISNDKELVEPYMHQFRKLWSMYNPIKSKQNYTQ